jgi:hypothetical protein
MEFDQIAQRIFRRHAVLIAVCLLIGVAAALLVHWGDVKQYTAVTRLTLDTPDPKSSAESLAVADTARAIVTSPTQIRTALTKAGVVRDPTRLSRNDVQLQQLGTSAVLQLSVRDRDPQTAASLANALAAQLVQLRLELRRGAAIRLAAQLDSRIDELSKQLDALNEQIVDRQARSSAAGPNGASTDPELIRLQNARTNLIDQKSALETERSQLSANDAMLPEASVIDPAVVPTKADPSRIPHDLALGILLGLTLGIFAAAVVESLRPSLVGGDAIARALGAPPLGALACAPGQGDCISGKDLIALAARLHLVAIRARLRSVALVSVKPGVEPTDLTDRLQRMVRLLHGSNGSRPPSPLRSSDIVAPASVGASGLNVLRLLYESDDRQTAAAAGAVDERDLDERDVKDMRSAGLLDLRVLSIADPLTDDDLQATGFVLIVPSPIASAELKPAVDALALTGRPLLGVIVYPRRSRRQRDLPVASGVGSGEIGQ